MTREELRTKAASRRTSVDAPPRKAEWSCTYCGKSYTRESAFMSHSCPEKRKIETLRSADGQNAFSYYNLWMKEQGRSEQQIETFGESRLFSTFLKFAEYAKKTNLPKVGDFIKFMVEQKLSPTMWTSDSVYSMYLQRYDQLVPPERQFMESVEELQQLAVELGVKLPEIFEALGPSDIINLLRRRKLSFWLLLASGRFRSYFTSLPEEDKQRLGAAMNVSAAVGRTAAEPKLFKELSAAATELGL
jgi:hypothetical protein